MQQPTVINLFPGFGMERKWDRNLGGDNNALAGSDKRPIWKTLYQRHSGRNQKRIARQRLNVCDIARFDL